MRIAITGSSGFIGSALVAGLESSGHEVLRVMRGDPSEERSVWQPSTGWFRDGALSGYDAVIHMTGVSIGTARWSDRRKKLIWESRVDATKVLIDHLSSLTDRPKTLISASAVGFYGDGGEVELTEDSPRGTGYLAELCEAWEQEAKQAEDLGIRTVLARSGIVLNSPDFLPRIVRPFKLGLGAKLGSGKQWMPWITLQDELRGIEFVLNQEEISGPVNLVAPPARNSEFTKALAKAVHRPAFLSLPDPVLRLQFGSELAKEALLTSQRVVASRLLEAGFVFENSEIDVALREALN